MALGWDYGLYGFWMRWLVVIAACPSWSSGKEVADLVVVLL